MEDEAWFTVCDTSFLSQLDAEPRGCNRDNSAIVLGTGAFKAKDSIC